MGVESEVKGATHNYMYSRLGLIWFKKTEHKVSRDTWEFWDEYDKKWVKCWLVPDDINKV